MSDDHDSPEDQPEDQPDDQPEDQPLTQDERDLFWGITVIVRRAGSHNPELRAAEIMRLIKDRGWTGPMRS